MSLHSIVLHNAPTPLIVLGRAALSTGQFGQGGDPANGSLGSWTCDTTERSASAVVARTKAVANASNRSVSTLSQLHCPASRSAERQIEICSGITHAWHHRSTC